jgi:hypothetical protein
MISSVLVKDRNTIMQLGIEALSEKLGPIGMVEFMSQLDSGYGDYSKERHTWLDDLSIEDICNEMTSTS